MSNLHYNGSNIYAPLKKLMPPHEWKEPVYGLKKQYAEDTDTSPLLSSRKKRKLIPNKLSKYFFITHKRWILLLPQH